MEVQEAVGAVGAEADSTRAGHAREYKGHNASSLDAPSKTIAGGGKGLGGGSGTLRLDTGEVRYYTVREAATLQTFPPTWEFDWAWSRAFVEIGNAVPPLLACVLGGAVATALDAVGAAAPAPVLATACGAPSPCHSPDRTPPSTPRPSSGGPPSAPAKPGNLAPSNPKPGNKKAVSPTTSAPAGAVTGSTAAAGATEATSERSHGAADQIDPSTPHVTWVKATALMGTPLERIVRLVAARVESFARPAPLLRQPVAKTGAMDTARVLSASAPTAPTASCTPMTVDEVWNTATAHVSQLRTALEAKMAALQASGGEAAAYMATELMGWLGVLEPPRLGDIDASVLALACKPTDPALALIAFPAWARPVTTPCMPPLPQPPPPAAIPGFATGWVHAFSTDAHTASLVWLRKIRHCCREFMAGVSGDALWRLLPRSMAFGIEHMQPWMAHLASAGHVVVRRGGHFEVVDLSQPPETRLNRAYIEELFNESGCTDLLLRDAALTHGFVYFTDLAPQMVFQTPLRSFFTSVEGFLSLHSEVLRMSANGWFELTNMPELDDGIIELCSCPGRYDPTGGVPRFKELRQRPIKNCCAPHNLLLCLAPPSPLLHELSGGGRVPVRSTNAATGVRESKGDLRAARAKAAGGKLPPAAQRHTPGLKRAAEAFGERDLLEVGRAKHCSSGTDAADAKGTRTCDSWAGGRWLWPQELKPFFIDLMLAACILGYGAELCNAPLYAGGDDISDMFHTFMLATLQCWSMGLLRLDPHNLTAESTDAALCAVQARCLEMGVAPSSNWAQRFVTECNLGFSKRFARANEKHLLALEAAHPRFAAWRAARRELSKQTGRDEAVGHWLSGYTDDIITLIIGVDSMVLFLCMHAEHYGPRGLNMKMAIAAKRSLGVHAKFIGGSILTTGMLAYVLPEKVLRTDAALQNAIDGVLTLALWTKLVGLLNHLVCILLMPYHIMYDVYDISDACRAARLDTDDLIITTPRGVKALRRWLAQMRSTAGTSALSSAFALRRAGGSGVVHALRSDAAILGTQFPANLYSAVYVLRLTPKWLEMPIVVLEFLGGLLNLVVFGPELRGAPCALLLDALVVPTVMAGKAKAPMMRFLQLRFVALVQKLGLNIEVGHEYGPFNPICDAGSRGKTAEMEAIMANLDLNLNYVDVPAEGLQLVDDAHAEWLRLSEAERAYAHAAADEEAARQRQHGASANSAPWPMVPPAREGAPRPRSEEERQTGRSRLNTDSSGASPYVYREVVTDDKFGMYNEVAPDDDLDEYTASSGGAAVRAAAVAAGGGPAEARRVRQRAGGRDAPSDVFGEAAAIAAGALQRRGLARQVDQMAAAQEMPPPRARRAAAALANVRLGENLYVESGGERQDHSHVK